MYALSQRLALLGHLLVQDLDCNPFGSEAKQNKNILWAETNKHRPWRVEADSVDSLCLSWRPVAGVSFGLHGVSALRNQTLPPGWAEANHIQVRQKNVKSEVLSRMKTHVLLSDTFCAISSYIWTPFSDMDRTKKALLSEEDSQSVSYFSSKIKEQAVLPIIDWKSAFLNDVFGDKNTVGRRILWFLEKTIVVKTSRISVRLYTYTTNSILQGALQTALHRE